jgi:hypothetical protein
VSDNIIWVQVPLLIAGGIVESWRPALVFESWDEAASVFPITSEMYGKLLKLANNANRNTNDPLRLSPGIVAGLLLIPTTDNFRAFVINTGKLGRRYDGNLRDYPAEQTGEFLDMIKRVDEYINWPKRKREEEELKKMEWTKKRKKTTSVSTTKKFPMLSFKRSGSARAPPPPPAPAPLPRANGNWRSELAVRVTGDRIQMTQELVSPPSFN